MGKRFAFIISTPPYDKRSAFTGARIALASLLEDCESTVILMEDGVYGALEGQESGQFFKTVEILTDFMEMGGELLVCGNCLKHRGIESESLIKGAEPIDLHILLQTMVEADQSLFF